MHNNHPWIGTAVQRPEGLTDGRRLVAFLETGAMPLCRDAMQSTNASRHWGRLRDGLPESLTGFQVVALTRRSTNFWNGPLERQDLLLAYLQSINESGPAKELEKAIMETRSFRIAPQLGGSPGYLDLLRDPLVEKSYLIVDGIERLIFSLNDVCTSHELLQKGAHLSREIQVVFESQKYQYKAKIFSERCSQYSPNLVSTDYTPPDPKLLPWSGTTGRGAHKKHVANFTGAVLFISCLDSPGALELQARDAMLAGLLEVGHLATLKEVLQHAVAAHSDPASAAVREDLGEPQPPRVVQLPENRKRLLELQIEEAEARVAANKRRFEAEAKTSEAHAEQSKAEASAARHHQVVRSIQEWSDLGKAHPAFNPAPADIVALNDLLRNNARVEPLVEPICLETYLRLKGHGTYAAQLRSGFGKIVLRHWELANPGQLPPKKEIYVHGQKIMANSYAEAHRGIIDAAYTCPAFQEQLRAAETASASNQPRSSASKRAV